MMKFCKVRDVKTPERGTPRSAGLDFFVPNDFPVSVVYPGYDILIPSGIKASIPEYCMLLGVDKSGMATSGRAKRRAGQTERLQAKKPSLIIGAKLVDEDYQGEIHIHLINVGKTPFTITPGMKIAQFVVVPVLYLDPVEVPEDELFTSATERGSGGFGSTN